MRLSIRKEVEMNRQATKIVQFVMIDALKKIQEEEDLKAMMAEMEEYLERPANIENAEKEMEKLDEKKPTLEERCNLEESPVRQGDSGLPSSDRQDEISRMLDDLEGKCGVKKASVEDEVSKMLDELEIECGVRKPAVEDEISKMMDDLERKCGITKRTLGDESTEQEGKIQTGKDEVALADQDRATVDPEGSSELDTKDTEGDIVVVDFRARVDLGTGCGDNLIAKGGNHEDKIATVAGTELESVLGVREKENYELGKVDRIDLSSGNDPHLDSAATSPTVAQECLDAEAIDDKIQEKKASSSSNKKTWKILTIFCNRHNEGKETMPIDSSNEQPIKVVEEKRTKRSFRNRLRSFFCCGKIEE